LQIPPFSCRQSDLLIAAVRPPRAPNKDSTSRKVSFSLLGHGPGGGATAPQGGAPEFWADGAAGANSFGSTPMVVDFRSLPKAQGLLGCR